MSTRTKKNKAHNTKNASDFMPTSSSAKQVLAERAEHLALTKVELLEANSELSYVRFRLDREWYGIPYVNAKEILHLSSLTKVPNVPKFVAGILNRRGMLITIIDLKGYFNLNKADYSEDAYIIVVQINHMTIGFLADGIAGSEYYDPTKLSSSLPAIGIKQEYILGIHNGINTLLNIEMICKDLSTQLMQH